MSGKASMSTQIDPITRSVVQHRLSSIVREMGEAMLRTSYSQILNSSRDFSLAICDSKGRLIAQADHIPVHVGALPWATLAVEERFKDVKPGDVILLNDPYHGGSHLPDLTAFVPFFDGERRLLWTIVRAHQSDIGGATHGAYNPSATEIYQEGSAGPADQALRGRKTARRSAGFAGAEHPKPPRVSRRSVGDGWCGASRRAPAVAAVHGIRRRGGRGGGGDDPGCRRTADPRRGLDLEGRRVLRRSVPRRRRSHGRNDIRIAAKVTKNGSDIEVDLSDSDPQTTSFVNSSHANMQAAVAMAFAYLIDADIPKNSGALRPLKVIARQGTIVWADPGRPVTLCTSHPSNEIVEAIIKAMSASCPERAMAGWGRRFRIAIQGENPRTGRQFIWHLFQARPGGGASSGGDGYSSIGEWHSAGGIKFGSIEVAEVRFPLHFRLHEFRENSGGDGQFRGGLGVSLDLILETEKVRARQYRGRRHPSSPCGMLGGEDGAPHAYRLLSEGREPRVLLTKETASKFVPAIAWKYARPVAAAGDRPRSELSRRASMTANKG